MLLDAGIRNYVLLPILVLMFLVTVLRNEIMTLFHSPPKTDLKKLRENHILLRSRRLRGNGTKIPKDSYDRRRAFLVDDELGLLTILGKPPANETGIPGMPKTPAMDPSSMMKGQVSMIFSQMYIIFLYNLIEHFFSGIVTAKLPFALTRGFKGMFHSGIDLPSLEVSYVSSSSWFLLIFSGLREVSVALFGAGNTVPMNPMAMPQQQPMFADQSKVFLSEKENIILTPHSSHTDSSLKRLHASLTTKH
uniref:ER membrane protein complex subunit 3 n=1 Tax=Arcella intermedia TaxID=1963864 RepID=A0A6B2LFZ1_9EUKA